MIELVILNHLKASLGVECYLEHPNPAPEEYVLLEKTGSSRQNYLNASTFAFQSCAASLYRAALLNENVKAAADALIALDEVASARLNSDYNYTDTETKSYRYQAVYDIKHY